MENTDKVILRRLAVLQQIADKNKPAQVVVTFASGNTIVTDSAGAVDLFQRMGAGGGLDSFHTDSPVYSEWAQMMTILLHPTEDRRLENFE